MKPTLLDPATATPVLREYYSRVLAYMAVAASIAAGTYVQHFGFDILWMVPYALLYPHLAHHLSLRFPGERTDRILLGVDTFHAGAAAVLLGFSVVPTLMMLLTLCFSAMLLGGLRQMTLVLGGALLSMAAVGLALQPTLKVGTPALVAVVSALFTTL